MTFGLLSYLERVPSLGCCHHLKLQGQHLHCLKQENDFLATMAFAASCKNKKQVNDAVDCPNP